MLIVSKAYQVNIGLKGYARRAIYLAEEKEQLFLYKLSNNYFSSSNITTLTEDDY